MADDKKYQTPDLFGSDGMADKVQAEKKPAAKRRGRPSKAAQAAEVMDLFSRLDSASSGKSEKAPEKKSAASPARSKTADDIRREHMQAEQKARQEKIDQVAGMLEEAFGYKIFDPSTIPDMGIFSIGQSNERDFEGANELVGALNLGGEIAFAAGEEIKAETIVIQDQPIIPNKSADAQMNEAAGSGTAEESAPGKKETAARGRPAKSEEKKSAKPAKAAKGGEVPAVLLDSSYLHTGDGDDPGTLTLAHYAAKAYLEYSLSVVKSRALPDIVDGMKPVQRRILYAMNRMRLAPPAKAVKCARVVGDVLGKYHPHGDQAAYEAMVRMAQDFTLRYPLVDGEGNFGSRDGDGAAAMRYTEARLTGISELLLSEIDSEDVDFVPNYDGSFKEPTLLPAMMPFVLLNGASGIAVGMATEIPPHNFTEVGNAVKLMLKNPQATLDDILAVLPAPDFPGGGQIISSPAEIRQIYESGRGSLKVRARYHFEELQRGQWQLVVDELPPAASAELVLSQIEEITNPKPKAGKKALSPEQQQSKTAMLSILDGVRNECDKDTKMRLVFEPKTSKVDRDLFVNSLLAQTSLESNAPMNMVMIGTDGRPRQKGLCEIVGEWTAARLATVRRRSAVRLERVNARLHILEGRCTAINDIDRVIEIVRFADDPKSRLMEEFHLSEVQAEDILELRLRQLARLEFDKIAKEMAALHAEAESLGKVINNESALRRLVAKEIDKAVKEYGDERRTLVQEAEKAVLDVSSGSEPVTVIISEKGYIRQRNGHGHDTSVMSYKMGDAHLVSFEVMSDQQIIAVGSNGRTYSVGVDELPGARGDGLPFTSFIELEHGTEIIGYVAGPVSKRVMLVNSAGFGLTCRIGDMVARVRSGKAFMKLDAGAHMLAPQPVADDDAYVCVLCSTGRMLCFETSEMRELSGGGKGVTLMELSDGETMIDFTPLKTQSVVVAGYNRGGIKSKIVAKADWDRCHSKRARKGKQLESRFTVTNVLRSIEKFRQVEALAAALEKDSSDKAKTTAELVKMFEKRRG